MLMPRDRLAAPGSGLLRGSVLVVEDDPQNARLLTRLLAADGFSVSVVGDGAAALTAVAQRPPDVILLDWMLPKLTGIEVCQRLKRDPTTRLIPVVLLTALDARENRLAGINAGADDFLTKPYNAEELRARVQSLVRLKRYTDELESAESVITSLALTVEARDATTDGHCQRLAYYATALGAAVGVSDDELASLDRGGYLHDVGKIGIPDSVLLKPSKLTHDEYVLIQQHTIIGERLCGNLRSLTLVRPIVRSHHERLNGSGYPDGLRGDAIPLTAQIVGIVDTFDAITMTRPYRAPRTREQAFDELLADVRSGLFDTELVAQFLRLVDHQGLELPRAAS
jgi:Response regulator containing a CheY-like receiver domain and an HD-GYP domain